MKNNSERRVNRDKSHDEELERWAKYVRENPEKWKAKLRDFLDAQIVMARRFRREGLNLKK